MKLWNSELSSSGSISHPAIILVTNDIDESLPYITFVATLENLPILRAQKPETDIESCLGIHTIISINMDFYYQFILIYHPFGYMILSWIS
jgi:hypothetical protein